MVDVRLPPLTRWGVSATADLVYRTLQSFGPGSAARIGDSLDLKSRQVRHALEELHALGAVALSRQRGSRRPDERVWAGVAPTTVLASLRERQQLVVQARRRLHEQLTRLEFPSAVGDPALLPPRVARALCGNEIVRDRIGELVAAERFEHLTMNPEPAFDTATIRAAAPLDRSLLDRGLTVRTLGVPAAPSDESGGHDQEMLGRGLSYRELPALPVKLMILDRATALLPLDPGDLGRGAWEIDHPATVAGLVSFFMSRWGQAIRPRRDWTPPMSLSPREKAVVALLAAGHTDADIAAKLGLSVRTIAYTLSALMQRYEVTNRFQLGLRLGAEGAQQPPNHPPTDEESH